MLPRFDSVNENIQLPRFQSDERRIYHDENQSADTAIKTRSEMKINEQSNKVEIKFLERVYDRSGKKCWPLINSNLKKMDLQSTYEIVGNSLESYIFYRKLNQCKALSNFIEYRNKVFKREKISPYVLSTSIKDISTKQMKNIPTKIIHIEENQTPSLLSSPSIQSEIGPSTPIPSLQSLTPKSSQNLSLPTKKESFNSTTLSSTASKSYPPTPIPTSHSLTPKSTQNLSLPTKKGLPNSIPSSSITSKIRPPTPISSSQSKTSKSTKKESLIPIPSPDLLKTSSSKQSKISIPKKNTNSMTN